ncbi:MAG: cupin domain-containing protein [Pseudomonadota bacterium]
MSDFDVGVRLKEVRIAAGLSQRGLADRAGVPHGQISLVETNKSSPTISSLRKILDGVPISLSEFFEPQNNSAGRVFFDKNELQDLTSHISNEDGAAAPPIVMRQVGNARAHNLQILHERYEPGSDTGATMLEHSAHEGGIVVSGEIEVIVGSQRKTLKAGDAYLFDSRQPHRFRNMSDEPAIVISACTPPYL